MILIVKFDKWVQASKAYYYLFAILERRLDKRSIKLHNYL